MFLSVDLPVYSSIQTEAWDSWGDQDRRLSHSITTEAVESAVWEVCFQKDLRIHFHVRPSGSLKQYPIMCHAGVGTGHREVNVSI